MAYFFTIYVEVTYPIIDKHYIKLILPWVRSTTEGNRDIIYNDSIDSFSNITMFKEKGTFDI